QYELHQRRAVAGGLHRQCVAQRGVLDADVLGGAEELTDRSDRGGRDGRSGRPAQVVLRRRADDARNDLHQPPAGDAREPLDVHTHLGHDTGRSRQRDVDPPGLHVPRRVQLQRPRLRLDDRPRTHCPRCVVLDLLCLQSQGAHHMSDAVGQAPALEQLNLAAKNPIVVRYPRASGQGVAANLALGLFGALFATPLLWMLLSSIDAHADWSVKLPSPTLSNYGALMHEAELRPLLNSLYLAGVATAVTTTTAVLSAYVLSRRHLPLRRTYLVFILFASGLPVT